MTSRAPQDPSEPRPTGGRGHGAKSAAVRDKAVLALLSERTITLAAKRAGVNESTLREWLALDTSFQADYQAARQATFQTAMSRIQSISVRAVDTLDELLDEKNPPAVRLGAARTVAEIGLHQQDAETIMRKLDEIEAAQRRGGRQ